jgi:glutathione S-transferase
MVPARLAVVQDRGPGIRRADVGASTRVELLLLSPSFLVPRLTTGAIKVWDTLAIAEYLNELYPQSGLLPRDTADAPAVARCPARCIPDFPICARRCP